MYTEYEYEYEYWTGFLNDHKFDEVQSLLMCGFALVCVAL